MNMRTGILLLFFAMAILSGVQKSFARPQYLNVFNEVYGDDSCGTCHVINSGGGQRDFNGTFRQHNSSNGTFERNSSNGTFDRRNPNRTPAASPAETASTGAEASPGFGIIATSVGLFVCALLSRRHNK